MTTFKEVSTLDAIIITLALGGAFLLALLISVIVLIRKVKELTPDEELQARAQARADKAKALSARFTSVKDSARDRVRPMPLLASLVILALVAMNVVTMAQMRGLQEELQTVLSGDVDIDDLPEEDRGDSVAGDEMLDQLEQLEAQLSGLREENQERADELAQLREANDELEARLAEQAEETDSSPPTATTASLETANESDREAARNWMLSNGWSDDQLRFENFQDNPAERGSSSFSSAPLDSHEALVDFLNEDNSQASAVRASLRESLDESDYRRALRGEGYVPVQMTVDAQYEGNSYWDGTRSVFFTTPREVKAGDIVWVYVGEDGEVVQSANVRADCANPRAEKVVPKEPAPERPTDKPEPDPEPEPEPEPDPEPEPEPEPEARFECVSLDASITSGEAPLDVSFDGEGFVEDTEIENYIFDFGDGESETTASSSTNYQYTEAGTYTATLLIQTGEATTTETADCKVTVEVEEEPDPEPEARFECTSLVADVTTGDVVAGEDDAVTVTYTAHASVENTEVESYIFHLGDGEVVETDSRTLTYEYAEPGTYQAYVLIVTSDGTTEKVSDCMVEITVVEVKCFTSDGEPVFEGEFCADPDEGPEQQDPRDDEVESTPGYDHGDAEETHDNQDEAQECIDTGECDPHDPTQDGVEVPDSEDGGEAPGGDVDTPDEQEDDDVPGAGGDNPEHDGSDPTENPDDGTSDPEDTPAEEDEDDNEGDPLDDLDLPNVP